VFWPKFVTCCQRMTCTENSNDFLPASKSLPFNNLYLCFVCFPAIPGISANLAPRPVAENSLQFRPDLIPRSNSLNAKSRVQV
jgi:hypothetical protein